MLAHLSDQMVQSIEEVTLLQQLVSYHVAYHLNEVHFVQYRALGVIFQDLHCLVQDQLSHLFQGSAQAPSSTFSAEVLCHLSQPAAILLYKFQSSADELMLYMLYHSAASRCNCCATAVRKNCSKASNSAGED